MDFILNFLFFTALILAIITVVGHGIWVLLAKFFGLFRSPRTRVPPTGPASEPRVCPRCRSETLTSGLPCALCGWPAQAVANARETKELRDLRALTAIEDQLHRLVNLGLLETSTEQQMLRVIQSRREQLRQALAERQAAASQPTPPALPAEPDAPSPETPEPAMDRADTEAAIRRRAEEFAARTHPLDEPDEPHEPREVAASTEPPKRKQSVPLSRLLAAFMEERNLRWGELVGGLLIVGCSIALVISFWTEIAERPFLKFFVFNGVTAALFGAGIYADRRLKLANTSQGLLIISSILVPLNFLAIASFSDTGTGLLLTLAGEAFSMLIFGSLLWFAGTALVGSLHLPLILGVLIPSGMTLLTRRIVGPESQVATLLAVAAVSVFVYVTLSVWAFYRVGREAEWDGLGVHRLFKWLGIVSFAVAMPLALLVARTEAPLATVHQLAPLVAILGTPALMAGMLVWRRVRSESLAMLRTAGIGIGVFGAGLLIAAIYFAWPTPWALAATTLADATIFTLVGVTLGIPAAQMVAAACLAACWTLASHVALGNLSWLESSASLVRVELLSATTGWILVPFTGLLAAASGWARYNRRPDFEFAYLRVAAGVAAVGLLLTSWFGLGRVGDPEALTWMYLLYAAGALGATLAGGRKAAAACAGTLLLASAVQGIVFRLPAEHPYRISDIHWLLALLVHATVVATLAWSTATRRFSRPDASQVFGYFAIGAMAAATTLLPFAAPATTAGPFAGALLWLALLALALALLRREPPLGLAFQVYSAAAAWFGVLAFVSNAPWSSSPIADWLQPRLLAYQGLALAAWCAAWSGLRLLVAASRHAERHEPGRDEPGRHEPGRDELEGVEQGGGWGEQAVRDARAFLASRWSDADHFVYGSLVVLLIGIATYAALPGAAQELAPRPVDARARVVRPVAQFELAIANQTISHQQAAAAVTWFFLATLVAAGLVGLVESAYRWRASLLLLTLWSVIPLLAAGWEAEVAVASALRWGLAFGMLVACALLWCRGAVRSRVAEPDRWRGHARVVRATIMAATFVPLVTMGIYVLAAATSQVTLDASARALVGPLLMWALVASLAILVVRQFTPASAIESTFRVRAATGLALLIGLGPSVVWLLYVVATALRRYPLTSPEPDSTFAQMGLAASYAIPLLVMTAALVGTAVRDRSQGYAFSGALMLHLAATAGFLLVLARLGQTLDGIAWIRVAQLNAIVAAVYAAPWNATLAVRRKRTGQSVPAPLLVAVLGFAVFLCVIHLAAPVAVLIFDPGGAAFAASASHWTGWLSVLATVAVAGWFADQGRWSRTRQHLGHYLAAILIPLALLLTLLAAGHDRGNWLAYHWLMLLWIGASCVLLLPGVVAPRELGGVQFETHRLVRLFLVAGGVLLSLRSLAGDPAWPWWAVGGLLAVGLQCTALAYRSAKRRYVYPAALLWNIAATVTWYQVAGTRGFNLFDLVFEHFYDLVYVNILAATIPCLAWVILERKVFQPAETGATRFRLAGLHRVVAWLSLRMAILVTAGGLFWDLLGEEGAWSRLAPWALLGLTWAVTLTLWDSRTRRPMFGLYLTGMLALAMLLDSIDLSGDLLEWTGTIFAGAYALATSFVINRRHTLVAMARQARVPLTARQCRRALRWIVPLNLFIALFVLAMAFWSSFTFTDFTFRFTAAQAALAQALSIGLLAMGRRRSLLQIFSLLLGLLAAIPLSWVGVLPTTPAPWLHRWVAIFVVMIVVSVLYAVGIVKLIRRENEWTRAAQRLVPCSAGFSILALAGLMIVEIRYYQAGEAVPMLPAALAITAATLLGMIVAAVAAAVVPGRDPLNLSERQRGGYIYAAEILLAVLVIHLRLTMPWLFAGVFEHYWPLVIMLVAFVGVGLAEYFQRRRQAVLSEPLMRTGIFLPVIPVLGFWIGPQSGVDYAGLLLSVGAFYAVLAVTRGSFIFAMVAVVAANGSLWHLLHRFEGLGLTSHPQLWIIPPAACILVAAHLNARQLGPQRMATIRYLAATFIYASSTADIFLNGVASAPWLPAVLALLSIAGIMLGIWLRIRAFLYLGTGFLLIALFTVIWHAAVDRQQTWVWWVSGIVTGILILVLFALFEKQRDRLLRVVEELKEWEG